MAGNTHKPRAATRHRSSSLLSDSDRPPSRPRKRVKRPDRHDAPRGPHVDAPPPRKGPVKTPIETSGRKAVPTQQLIDALQALEPGVLGRLLGLQVQGGPEDGTDSDEEESQEEDSEEGSQEEDSEEGSQEEDVEEDEASEENRVQGEDGGAEQGKAGMREDDDHGPDSERELEHKAHRLSSALGAPFARARSAAKADTDLLFARFTSDLEEALEPFNGKLAKQQYGTWQEAETVFRRKCTASYAEAHKAMAGCNEQMRELVRKIKEARATKARLVEEARKALNELLVKQGEELDAIELELGKARDHERPNMVRATDPKALGNLLEQSIGRMLRKELLY